MSTDIRSLEPTELWNHFSDLNAVPRASKKEEGVINFMVDFGRKLGLETFRDETGNVIIKKPATGGMENRVILALQGHLDMVHQQNEGTGFDFANSGINMFVDGDWVKAKGTTLGADNGIGVASIMALLSSTEIPHPAIEALFTIDEETGMTGAMGLEGGLLKAGIMLNLDTEDDTELTIGCAGGVDVTATGTYAVENIEEGSYAILLSVKGLKGGHSGMDIHKGRGNANKLLNRLLHGMVTQYSAGIGYIHGGGLRNAIPREAVALVVVPPLYKTEMKNYLDSMTAILKAEYNVTDPGLSVQAEDAELPVNIANKSFTLRFVNSVYACANGIYRMSPDIAGLVQTSNNIARVWLENGSFSVQCLTRSAVESEKMDQAQGIASAFAPVDAKINLTGGYPGWKPAPGSAIVTLMKQLYKNRFGEEPNVSACHAGLECGILGRNYPHMEMISFGPNILGAHSPDERVQVSSVQKFWGLLLETIASIPLANTSIISSQA